MLEAMLIFAARGWQRDGWSFVQEQKSFVWPKAAVCAALAQEVAAFLQGGDEARCLWRSGVGQVAVVCVCVCVRRHRGVLSARLGVGQTGQEVERRRRLESMRGLQARMEAQLKPILELLSSLKDTRPPDYGPLVVRLRPTLWRTCLSVCLSGRLTGRPVRVGWRGGVCLSGRLPVSARVPGTTRCCDGGPPVNLSTCKRRNLRLLLCNADRALRNQTAGLVWACRAGLSVPV
jgi:hypothetical protein